MWKKHTTTKSIWSILTPGKILEKKVWLLKKKLKKSKSASNLQKPPTWGTNLSSEEKAKIVDILKRNIDLFPWKPSVMLGIEPNIMCHSFVLNPKLKLVSQLKRKGGKEKRKTIVEEVDKVMKDGFIGEIQYPTWLSNVIMVKKKTRK